MSKLSYAIASAGEALEILKVFCGAGWLCLYARSNLLNGWWRGHTADEARQVAALAEARSKGCGAVGHFRDKDCKQRMRRQEHRLRMASERTLAEQFGSGCVRGRNY